MSTIHKCPFCLHSFERSKAIPEEINNGDITLFRCPNPKEKSNGQKFCDKVLPPNFFDAESTVISIAGSKYVGKTYYLISLLIQIKKNRSFQKLGISGELIGDEFAKRQIESNIELIKNGGILGATLPGALAHENALVIDLTINNSIGIKHVYLSFFDTPGESYNNLDFMIRNMQCIYKADGLLFLVEPMQIEKFRETVFETYPKLEEKKTHDLQEVFYNVLQLLKFVQNEKVIIKKPIKKQDEDLTFNEETNIELDNNIQNNIQKPNYNQENVCSSIPKKSIWKVLFNSGNNYDSLSKKIKCPIAIGITKIDQIKKIMFNEIPYDYIDFETMYLNNGKINTDLISDISNEIKTIIFDENDGEIAVKNMLEAEVLDYEFFGIKSGKVDSNGKQIISMKNPKDPQGVLLPLIWLLLKLKLL